MNDADKKERKKQRVAKRKKQLREKAALARRQVDKNAKGRTIFLQNDAPIPGRNSPCPLHPDFKIKRCPHGCLALFLRNRDRHAGTLQVVRVAADDARQGRTSREIDPVVGAIDDLAKVTGGEL